MTWPGAATLLREVPHTYLLGASRAEDFHPSLLVGATRVVQPRLDKATAVEIGSRIHDLGITQRMDVQEALESSEGLLMEFLALLTTGQRLRQVLAVQVAGLAQPGPTTSTRCGPPAHRRTHTRSLLESRPPGRRLGHRSRSRHSR
jgi:hypothetical protein